MLPVLLQPSVLAVGVAGQGEGLARRAALLADAGVEARLLAPDASDAVLASLRFLFVAGLPEAEARPLAVRARALGLLVNVEDCPVLCDFHVPAVLRRDALVLTVSTGGTAPALARMVREWLAGVFGPEWGPRTSALGAVRARWRAEGLGPAEVSRRLRAHVAAEGWL